MNRSIARKIADLTDASAGATPPVARLLADWQSGDSEALHRLTPLIYEELRRRARQYMQWERTGHTLQATAVVNEAFVRLLERWVPCSDRKHLFALVARQMRRVLIDHARTHLSGRRGRGQVESLDGDESLSLLARESDIHVLELDDALNRLAQHDERLANLVEIHYFVGLTSAEIAKAVGMSEATIERHLRLARAWLLANMRPRA